MKLNAQQLATLSRAMNSLESADTDIQTVLGADKYCYELHSRITDLCAEIEQMIEEESAPTDA